MQAVITSGGKQYFVQPDQTLEVELVGDAKTLTFEPLLVIDGDNILVGAPTVADMVVTADVLGEVKGEKIQVLKFKAKKRVHSKTGHRQHYSQIKITGIGAPKKARVAATK